MRLAPRPPRMPLACPCGARLSVIPRLQGTEVKCPRCKESLQVPGDPLEQSAVVITSEPAESVPVAVATQQVQGSGTRDIFGTLLSEPAARLHAALDETIPKSLKALREESGYQDVYNYIQKLLKEGKVRSVELRGNRTGYIIDPNWLRRVQDTLPTEKLPSAAVPLFPDEPLQEAEIIQSSTAVSSTGDTSKKARQEFRPIGRTQPTRKQIPKQRPRSLFEEQPRSSSDATPQTTGSLLPSTGRLELSSSQKKIFDAVESSYVSTGVSPSIRELQAATSLNHVETINAVDSLVRKGLFEWDRSAARGIRIIPEAERITLPDHIDTFIGSTLPLSTEPPDTFEPVADLAPSTASKTPGHVADAAELSSQHSPVKPADSMNAVPVWIEEFLTSKLLDQQFRLAGRQVPTREQIKTFLQLVANHRFSIHRETLCRALDLPAIRYAGFLAIVTRLFNVDNVPILTRDDNGEMARLNIDLLCRQFGIARP